MNFVYLVGSLIGVALIVGLNVALFGRAKPVLGNLQDLGARIAADIPGFRAGRGVVGNDGAAALIEDEAGAAIFLVRAFGDRIVTRKLSHGALRRAASGWLRTVATTPGFHLSQTPGSCLTTTMWRVPGKHG